MSDLERAPILRVMPGPTDINANGHIFGGWVLSQMDIAAGIVATRRARGPVATIAIEAMTMSGGTRTARLIDSIGSVTVMVRKPQAASSVPSFFATTLDGVTSMISTLRTSTSVIGVGYQI